MTSKDIFMARLASDNSMPLPVFLRHLSLGMDVINVKTTDVFGKVYDHELSAKAIIATQKFTGEDAVVGCIQTASLNSESFGGTIKYPEYGMPMMMDAPLDGVADLSAVPVTMSEMCRGNVKSYSIVREKLPDVAVVANVEGPVTKAGILIDIETLALSFISEDGYAEEAIRLGVEHSMMFIEELHKNESIDCVFLAAATDNPDLFGEDVYANVVLKWVKKMTSDVEKMGYRMIFHPHGCFSDLDESVMKKTINTGIAGFQYGDGNDPGKITSMISGKCAVLGGTDIVPTLLRGLEEKIRSETLRHIRECSAGSHIFMPSCSLHRGMNLDNLRIMIDAVKEYNKLNYPNK